MACNGREDTTIRMCDVEGSSHVEINRLVNNSINVLASESVVRLIQRLLELRYSFVCFIRSVFTGRFYDGRGFVQQTALCPGRGSNEEDE